MLNKEIVILYIIIIWILYFILKSFHVMCNYSFMEEETEKEIYKESSEIYENDISFNEYLVEKNYNNPSISDLFEDDKIDFEENAHNVTNLTTECE